MNISEFAVEFTSSNGSEASQLAANNVIDIIKGKPRTILAAPSPYWTGDFMISRSIAGVSVLSIDENNQLVAATVFVSNS